MSTQKKARNLEWNQNDRSCSYLKEEAKANPLIVFDVTSFFWVDGLVNARMGDVNTNPLPEGTWNGVSRMNPAVRVEDIFGDVFGVNTVDWIAYVLSRRHDQAKCQQTHDGERVVESKDGTVDVNVTDFDEGLETPENVQHGLRFIEICQL